MPAALAVDWDQIKQAAIAGVSFPELARQWEMLDDEGKPDTSAIRKRCSREGWPVPRSIMASASLRLNEAKAAQNAAREQMQAKGEAVTVVTPPPPNAVIAGNIAEMGAKSNLHALALLQNKLQRASESPDSIRDLENVGDIVTALKGARLAAGMDKEGSQVTLNLSMFGAQTGQGVSEEGPVWEVESSPTVETEDGETCEGE